MTYKLTGPLKQTSCSTSTVWASGVSIGAANVTINLNGYTITGPGTSCSAGIPGNGIDNCLGLFSCSPYSDLTVTNGTITNFFGSGVISGDYTTVTGVRIYNVADAGIVAGNDCVLEQNILYDTQFDGVLAGTSCTVEYNVVDDNSEDGISVSDYGPVDYNSVTNNASYGLNMSSDSHSTEFDQNTINNNSTNFSGGTDTNKDIICSGSPC